MPTGGRTRCQLAVGHDANWPRTVAVGDRDGVHVVLGHDPGHLSKRRVASTAQDPVMHRVADADVLQLNRHAVVTRERRGRTLVPAVISGRRGR
jgi:hypothetical protein